MPLLLKFLQQWTTAPSQRHQRRRSRSEDENGACSPPQSHNLENWACRRMDLRDRNVKYSWPVLSGSELAFWESHDNPSATITESFGCATYALGCTRTTYPIYRPDPRVRRYAPTVINRQLTPCYKFCQHETFVYCWTCTLNRWQPYRYGRTMLWTMRAAWPTWYKQLSKPLSHSGTAHYSVDRLTSSKRGTRRKSVCTHYCAPCTEYAHQDSVVLAGLHCFQRCSADKIPRLQNKVVPFAIPVQPSHMHNILRQGKLGVGTGDTYLR